MYKENIIKKQSLKSEKGAITVLTIATVLLMIAFLVSTYIIILNRRQSQEEIKKETKAVYEKEIAEVDEIYENTINQADTPIKLVINKPTITLTGTKNSVLENYRIYGNCTESRLPEEYQEVEYIQSNGTQYINLGIKANLNTKVELDFKLNQINITQWLFGSRTSTTSSQYNFVIGSDNNFATPLSTQSSAKTFNVDNAFVTSDMDRHLFIKEFISPDTMGTFDGEEVKTIGGSYKIGTFETPYEICLFNSKNSGKVTDSGAHMNCYLFKMWNDNILVRNFIPCYRKSDNVAGMYDLCGSICPLTGTPFYINSGSGTFEQGDPVYIPRICWRYK